MPHQRLDRQWNYSEGFAHIRHPHQSEKKRSCLSQRSSSATCTEPLHGTTHRNCQLSLHGTILISIMNKSTLMRFPQALRHACFPSWLWPPAPDIDCCHGNGYVLYTSWMIPPHVSCRIPPAFLSPSGDISVAHHLSFLGAH